MEMFLCKRIGMNLGTKLTKSIWIYTQVQLVKNNLTISIIKLSFSQ